ncbi:MAG: histidine kinase [Ekhidna sp.]
MKRLNILIHTALWLTLAFFIFSAFGQRLRVYESSEVDGLRYYLKYDYLMLPVIIIDVGLKAIMFYLIIHFSKNGTIRLSIRTVFSITMTLIISLGLWLLYQYTIDETTGELIFDYMMPYSIAFHFIIPFVSFGFSSNKYRKELEKHNIETELHLLRSQINPHFLFNTLNNIYSIAKRSNIQEVPESISKLARIMRYMTNETSKNEVSLSMEIEYLNDYVDLQKIRLVNPSSVSVQVDVTNKNLQIAPMLFIPFIENAFKFGSASNFIDISLTESDGSINLMVKNGINKIDDIETGGFGIENATKRLNLIYQNVHTLEINHANEVFGVELNLYLKAN